MIQLPFTHANIIKILGVETLPLQERIELVETVADLVDTRLRNRILESLDEPAQKELVDLLEREESDGVKVFFETHNIDMLALMEEEVEKVKHELHDIYEEG